MLTVQQQFCNKKWVDCLIVQGIAGACACVACVACFAFEALSGTGSIRALNDRYLSRAALLLEENLLIMP
jgi:hypothetical protein